MAQLQGAPPRADVVVVGGGVMGASVAFHLTEAGADVVLLESGELGRGSSGKPIGGVRAQFSDPANVALGRRSLELFEDFRARPGADIGLRQAGYLFALPTDDDVELFGRSVAMQRDLGVDSRLLTVPEARRLNPYLSATAYAGAAYAPRDGWAHPAAVVAGYVDGARRRGATVVTHAPATAVEPLPGGRVTVVTPRGRVTAPVVVVCAGAWSRAVGALADVDLPVDPVRRQIAFTAPLEPAPPTIPFTIDFGTTYYLHNADAQGTLLLGASEPGTPVGFDTTYDPAWEPWLRGLTARATPALADAPLTGGWAGLYELTPDHDALIGEATSSGAAGGGARVLYACGFSGHGFLQAPAVGEAVTDLYLGRAGTPAARGVDVSAFDAGRFGARRARTEANII
ncbi:NAD(P)/FAD-dependent oxidoreductase [Krasilnikoviella flava]|uniref:Sarcosine oxidase subunit beta n=1 Tax=Krasilnikoviella flava TaxID=526729 RepID=A0A1T5KYP3_9MICO|nr:FAD-binding oxidoreductase [Krasilnikoviella flava]SKC68509.1 sarcosine oxidase subunit beta [Krasilnikoviella flava]